MKIVNATALDPEKIYILEGDRRKVSSEQVEKILAYLHAQGIRGICVRTYGGDGLRVVEVAQEKEQS